MFRKFLFVLIVLSALNAGFRANAGEPEVPQPVAKDELHIVIAKKVQACEAFLAEKLEGKPKAVQLLAKGAGYVTLATPISWALRSPDKAKFLIETAQSGVWINLAGAVLGKVFSGHMHNMPDIVLHPWDNYLSPYISYQIVNAARQGVGLKEGVSTKDRIKANWVMSVYVYSLTDLMPKILASSHVDPTRLATSVTYFALWATVSEVIRQYGTNPLFYHMFPKASMIKKMLEVHSSEALIAEINADIERLRVEHEALKASGSDPKGRAKEIRDEILAARGNIFWIKWARKGLAEGEQIPDKRFARMAKIKHHSQIGVGVSLLALFFTGKMLLSGDDKHPGYFYRMYKKAGESIDDLLSVESQKLFDKIEDQLVSVLD